MPRKVSCKNFSIQLALFLYNIGNAAIFFRGANEFSTDMGFSENKVLEELADFLTWDGLLLTLSTGVLLISNQRAFPQNLEDILDERRRERGEPFEEEVVFVPSTREKCLVIADSAVTSAYKGMVLSLSTTVSLKQIFNISSNPAKYATLVLTFSTTILSNFIAELSIYLKHYLKKTDILPWFRGRVKNPQKMSYWLAAIFNIGEIALYFNNMNKSRESLRLSDSPASAFSDRWDILLFIYEGVSSLLFCKAIQDSFKISISYLLMNYSDVRNFVIPEEKPCKTAIKKVAAYSSIIYKSLNIALACMVIMLLVSGGDEPSIIVSGVVAFGVNLLAQYTIYRPTSPRSAPLLSSNPSTMFVGAADAVDSDEVALDSSLKTGLTND